MEALLVRRKSESAEALAIAVKAVDDPDSIIGVKERKLKKLSSRDFRGTLRVHLYGKGNITKKLLFLMNSPAAQVISWPGVMEIGISA